MYQPLGRRGLWVVVDTAGELCCMRRFMSGVAKLALYQQQDLKLLLLKLMKSI
jgi:hypothetical protein